MEMDRRMSMCILVAFLVVFIAMEAAIVQGQSNGNGNGNNGNGNGDNNNGNGNGNNNNGNRNGNNNNGNGNGNNNNGNGNGSGNGSSDNDKNGSKDKPKKHVKTDAEDYDVLTAVPETGQERAFCKAQGACYYKTLTCPSECHVRKPKKNRKNKACFINCGSKCEAICKWRKPKCTGYGSLCYDPRFVGGDGVMFYFHGAKGGNFAVVSDDNLHINAHFIGSRPQGRTRDYTWVQALSVMFDTHTLVLAAKRVSHWDDNVDALIVRWEGEDVTIPTNGEAEWRINSGEREVVVERTDDTNTVKLTVSGLVEMDVRVTPIGEKENRAHNYQLPSNDSFAHLETQFKFTNPSDLIEGVLGKTYRQGYVSPVKRGVPMPMMGGEDKYKTSSLYTPACNVCRFQRQSEVPTIGLSKY